MKGRKQSEPSDPVSRVVRAALAWGQAMDKNDSRAANRIHDRDLVPGLRAVMAAGPDCIQRLVDLVDDPNPSVAHISALFALRFDAQRAEKALKRLSNHPSLHIGFSAEWGLKDWKKGKLELAWEKQDN